MKAYYLFKGLRRLFQKISEIFCTFWTYILFWGNCVSYQKFQTSGIPYVSVAIGGKCTIGNHFRMLNGIIPTGSARRCVFFVDKGAVLEIGEHVGITQTAIVCMKKISIGNHVKIGGGVCIYDSDFHSLDPVLRMNDQTDFANTVSKEVVIEDNVFIGGNSLILKGVTIGKNSIIGAGSVVTKSVPANQIWAGNPAKFVKTIDL